MSKRKFESSLFRNPLVYDSRVEQKPLTKTRQVIDISKPPADGKRRIVLVWSEHPAEGGIAGLHARRVANILQKKYGILYEVLLHKIPYSETNIGIVRRESNEDEIERKLRNLPESLGWAGEISDKYNAAVFNFHTSSPQTLSWGYLPRRYQSSPMRLVIPLENKAPHVVMFEKRGDAHTIEIPAVESNQYKKPRSELVQKLNRLNARHEADLNDLTDARSNTLAWQLIPGYQTKVNKLKRQGKFASQSVSRQIARAIHETMFRIADYH